jgi:hypothetical protein
MQPFTLTTGKQYRSKVYVRNKKKFMKDPKQDPDPKPTEKYDPERNRSKQASINQEYNKS